MAKLVRQEEFMLQLKWHWAEEFSLTHGLAFALVKLSTK